ncbi:MAG TPA: DoxX family protein [Ignavibacteriaceae bacterium]|nr:DoxX family protein [Ignavibacteriaceae bacterium]
MNDFAIFLLRVTSGAFMLFAHGLPKLNRLFSGGEIRFSDPLGIGTVPSLALAVFSEFFCSILLILGLLTRASLIPLIITMLVAAFIHHAGDPFLQIEKALLFLLIFVVLFLTGPGKFALGRIVKIKSDNKLIKYLFE